MRACPVDRADDVARLEVENEALRAKFGNEPAVPDGFPAVDEFAAWDATQAGWVLITRIVCGGGPCTKDQAFVRTGIYRHWKTRLRLGTSDLGTAYRSKCEPDTAIHDRDRPAGWKFYRNAVKRGLLHPKSCKWHRIDENRNYTILERQWAADWPFTATPLSKKTLRMWLNNPHDTERFVARGPIDLAPAYFSQYINDGCFDPAQFERYDVAITAFVGRHFTLCAEMKADHVVCSYQAFRCYWSPRARRRCAKRFAKTNSSKDAR